MKTTFLSILALLTLTEQVFANPEELKREKTEQAQVARAALASETYAIESKAGLIHPSVREKIKIATATNTNLINI